MQSGDTSFSDETTGVLLFDEWTPTGGPDFFADDHTTTTWISVANTWADSDEATRRLQSQDAANMLHRMAAPQIDWDGDDSTTQTWGHQHLATLSNAVFRAPPRTLDTRGASAADLASARLRARARSNAAAIQQSQVPSEADLASARLRARSRASQYVHEAYAAPVATPASASQRVAKAVSARATETRAANPAATPTLRTAPFVTRALVTRPVAARLTTMRAAPLVSLPTNRVQTLPDTWLVPRTQSQLVMMTLVPGVALFAAVLVARVLLATAGPGLSSSPTLVGAPSEQAAPIQRAAPVQQTPEPAASEPAAPVVVPPVQLAPAPAAPQTKVAHVHHEHTSATPTHRDDHSDDVAPNASHQSTSATVQGEGILRINSRPWAEVFVDGALVGHTPQPNLHLSAGAHQVELINRAMGMSKALRVQIRPGQTETQIINLIE